jgi:alkylation response protein AidB-like acyl-CoA dehydrogenase
LEAFTEALSPDEDAFRAEVRAFLADKFTNELRTWASRQAGVSAEVAFIRVWRRILFEKGWVAPTWPVAYGGPGWSPRQVAVFRYECACAGVPHMLGTGFDLCGPVIMRFGTPAQKDFFLPRMLSGEHYWCQGYSEPQAGSDLAALQTRAVRDGDDYVVNGSKIWTSHAHEANWIFMLVRTDTSGKRQQGITFLVSPMDAPGIVVRPIISMTGEHEVNQVFLENVRIPIANRVGPENEGWTVAKYLLEHERAGGAFAISPLFVALETVKAIAREAPGDHGGALADDPSFRRKLTWLEIDLIAAKALEERLSRSDLVSDVISPEVAPSIKKLSVSERGQAVSALAMETLGPYAAPDQRAALGIGANEPPIGPDYALTPTAKYLIGRASTIYAGSSEVQRNIVARAALGL